MLRKNRVEIQIFLRFFLHFQGPFFDVECLTIQGLFGIIQEL